MSTPRNEVYAAIDGERDYQNRRWGENRNQQVGSFLTLLNFYVGAAQSAWTKNSGDIKALNEIRKIAAIAVACMETHGAPRRV